MPTDPEGVTGPAPGSQGVAGKSRPAARRRRGRIRDGGKCQSPGYPRLEGNPRFDVAVCSTRRLPKSFRIRGKRWRWKCGLDKCARSKVAVSVSLNAPCVASFTRFTVRCIPGRPTTP